MTTLATKTKRLAAARAALADLQKRAVKLAADGKATQVAIIKEQKRVAWLEAMPVDDEPQAEAVPTAQPEPTVDPAKPEPLEPPVPAFSERAHAARPKGV